MSEGKNIKPVVRFAPSPTGFLHIGSARTALFNYLYAKKTGGKYILRIEDTDKTRSTKEFEEDILKELKWLGINYDEMYRQSERTNIYSDYLHQLVDKNLAYISQESEGESESVIRLRNIGKNITFSDSIRGTIAFDTSELGDFVIAKDFDQAIYHFVVVVDDFLMGITNVIRGEEHLSNTPRQILIQEAFGWPRVEYTHLPLILNPDKSKMSKRTGATAVCEYRETGYLPEAIINFLVFLGWSAQNKTNEEIFPLEKLMELFNLTQLQSGGAVFNIEKLDWMNEQHIRLMTEERLGQRLFYFLPDNFKKEAEENKKLWQRIITSEKGRIHKLCDIKETAQIYFETPKIDPLIIPSPKNRDKKTTKEHLQKTLILFQNLESEIFSREEAKEVIWPYAEEKGREEVLWPLRVALTGREKSPDPFTVSFVLGKEETLKRIKNALDAL